MKPIDIVESTSSSIMPSTDIDPLTGRPGIPGGIVFFCGILTIINPIMSVLGSASTWGTLSRLAVHSPSLAVPIYVATWAPIAFSCYGIYVANSLWTVRTKAIGRAKIYLLSVIAANILISTMFLLYELSPEQRTLIIISGAVGFAISLALNGPWLVYLSKSSRVLKAYGLK